MNDRVSRHPYINIHALCIVKMEDTIIDGTGYNFKVMFNLFPSSVSEFNKCDLSCKIMQIASFKILIEYFVNLWYSFCHALYKAYFKSTKEG